MKFQSSYIRKDSGKSRPIRSGALLLSAWSLVPSLWLTVPAGGQGVKLTGSETRTTITEEKAKDPLGRSTPRGTFTEFIRAMRRDDIVSAARFMQLTPKQKPQTEALARELGQLMDRYFAESLSKISDSPEGDVDDGLPLDRERLGPLKIGGKKFDIILVRIEAPGAGLIWLISVRHIGAGAGHARCNGKDVDPALYAGGVAESAFPRDLISTMGCIGYIHLNSRSNPLDALACISSSDTTNTRRSVAPQCCRVLVP